MLMGKHQEFKRYPRKLERAEKRYFNAEFQMEDLLEEPDELKDGNRYVAIYSLVIFSAMSGMIMSIAMPHLAGLFILVGIGIIPTALLTAYFLDTRPEIRPILRYPLIKRQQLRIMNAKNRYRRILFNEISKFGYNMATAVESDKMIAPKYQLSAMKDGKPVTLEVVNFSYETIIMEAGKKVMQFKTR